MIALHVVGSVPDGVDLAANRPVQVGVTATAAVARAARFGIRREQGPRY